jgi:dTDP-4-dehydrorhamnose 3,5-epimerase
MTFENTSIRGAWVYNSLRHTDSRGSFEEQFRLSELEGQIGRSFGVMQVNRSTSSKGVIRGIHYTEGSLGQAKYVSCYRGRVWDVVVDLRQDSETFGSWVGVELSPENGKSLLISEGLGHAFLSLEEGSVVSYLCSSEFEESNDRTINPFSEKLSIDFIGIGKQNDIFEFNLSEKDSRSLPL